jgi:hypothetical protein
MSDNKPVEAAKAFSQTAATTSSEPICPALQQRVTEEVQHPPIPFHDPADTLEPYGLN